MFDSDTCERSLKDETHCVRCRIIVHSASVTVPYCRWEEQASTAASTVLNATGGRVRELGAGISFDLLVELQVQDEGCAEGLQREAALGQMDGLREGRRDERFSKRTSLASQTALAPQRRFKAATHRLVKCFIHLKM